MANDISRLDLLLRRLGELEQRQPCAHERAIVEASLIALRDEIRRLAHALHDNSYWQPAPGPRRRAG